MGSWDACCGISKLPICVDDEVVDFFIGEVGRYRDSGFICYSNDLWTPLTIHTYGKYDDYGRIVPEIGWHIDYVAQMLRKHAVPLDQGENKYHDIPIIPDTLDYDLAQDAIHEGRLYLKLPGWVSRDGPEHREGKGHTGIGIRVTRMMVHRFVFDNMVSWGIENWRYKIDLTSLIQAGIEGITKQRNEEAHDFGDEATNVLMKHLSRLTHRNERDNEFFNMFHDSESGDLYVPHRVKDYLNYLLDVDTLNTDAITDLAKFIVFRFRLSEMQFLWTPQLGSQDHAYDSLSKLYRLCDDYAQKQLKEYEDEDED